MPPAVAPTRSGRTSAAGSGARRYPFDLLESKLLAPQGRGGTVPRGELIEMVDGSRALPVVVLSAGPGWGKTTLLAQWASAVAAPVCMGIRGRDGQRSGRPADLCRGRARPRLATRSERVRRARVGRCLDRGDGRPAPGSGAREDQRGPRPSPRRSAPGRQPALPRRDRSAHTTRLEGVTDRPLDARPAGASPGSLARARARAGDRAGRSSHGR